MELKPYFLQKMKVEKNNLLQFLFGAVRAKMIQVCTRAVEV